MTDFQIFILKLKEQLLKPLPGKNAQWKMAPVTRLSFADWPAEPRLSNQGSVLILLYPSNGKILTVFIQRPEYDGVHSGQISLPGGKHEPADITHDHTALREAEEEIGVIPSEIEIIGKLTDLFIPPSNFLVKPFVGIMPHTPVFKPDPQEVAEVLPVCITELFDPNNRITRNILIRDQEIQVPGYKINHQLLWGATAMIISELEEIVKKSFPCGI